MADTKISALSAAAAGLTTHEFPANEAGASKKVTGAQLKTLINTAPAWAAGSASAASWPTLGSGTLLTTAEAGAIERDANAFYMTTDAGNRGVVGVRHFIRADATRTMPNNTSENALFNSPANGRVTLETGTYLFESHIRLTGMSGTSGNALIDFLGAGTATAAAWMWYATALDNTNPESSAAWQSMQRVTQDTQAAPMVTAGTGTALGFYATGTFEITAAGTLIPSLALQTATAAATVAIGSYFSCERVGSTSVASVGQWD